MKRFLLLFLLAGITALPFALRPARTVGTRADDTVVIITPHNEAIRHEYGRGFAAWYQARTGRSVRVDWRVIGGTSEIARFLEGEYTTAFRNHWERTLRRPWSSEVQAGFQQSRLAADAPAVAREARAAFLQSDVGCGIDVFFGGGTYDFVKQAQAGRLVDSGLAQRHPEWFRDDVIPLRYAGEEYRDPAGLWCGAVLASYGIIFNRERLAALGIGREPTRWADLADPRLQGVVALADPTKSGSVAKAFENILQEQMQRRWQGAGGGSAGPEAEARAVAEGWRDGMRLIQLIAANARYFTDSSQKPPIDVAAGDCAAGICIDFYGRQQEEAVRRRGASSRVGFVAPTGGVVASVDPIGLLRGSPNRAVAVAFIDYTLSLDGQKLWSFRPGTPGGPERFALRRMPVRKDFYSHPDWTPLRSDPEVQPFSGDDPLVYREAWTGKVFREMAFLIRVICQDAHPELKAAWAAIQRAPEPRRSAALAVLQDLDAISLDRVKGEISRRLQAKDKVSEVRLAGELGARFRAQYDRARAVAEGR